MTRGTGQEDPPEQPFLRRSFRKFGQCRTPLFCNKEITHSNIKRIFPMTPVFSLSRTATFLTGTMVLATLCLVHPSAAGAEGPVPEHGSVSVKQTMEAVLKHHAGLAALQENREAVRHEVTRAKAGWGPRVDAEAHIGVGSLSNSTTRAVDADTSFDHFSGASLTVTQPLWDGLATRSRVRSAQATLDSMQERLFDNATTYALDGLIAHLDVIRNRELVQLAKKNVNRHEKILADTRNREQLGADSMAEVTHTQGRLSRAQSTLTQAELALEEAERNYQRLTGFRAPAHLDPVRMPDGMYDGPADIMAQAEKTNPKLAAYVDDIRAAQADKELAEAARQPVINLQGGPQTSHRGGPADLDTDSVDIRLAMSWTLFRSGADIAEEKAAMARVRQARMTLQNLQDELGQQIDDAWNAWLTAQRLAANYKEAVRFNTLTRDAYLEQFVLGERSLLDILDAESELYNSETELLTARNNIVVGAWRIYGITGRLLPIWRIHGWDLYEPVHHRDARRRDKDPLPLTGTTHRHNLMIPEADRDTNPGRYPK